MDLVSLYDARLNADCTEAIIGYSGIEGPLYARILDHRYAAARRSEAAAPRRRDCDEETAARVEPDPVDPARYEAAGKVMRAYARKSRRQHDGQVAAELAARGA